MIVSSIQAQFYNMGLKYDDEQYEKAPKKVLISSRDFIDLPDHISLKKYCPKPGNQLQMNTSAAWAVSWSAYTIIEAQLKNWSDRYDITRNAYSPVYTYTLVKPESDRACLKGATLFDALNALKNQGTVKYKDFQEFCPKDLASAVNVQPNGDHITDFVRLFDIDESTENKINSIKKVLSENRPVVVGMVCPPSFQTAKEFWQPREKISDHFPAQALCVMGYDDDKFGGAVEVMNSWGTDWGNGGFMWIRYGDFARFTRYAYELIKAEDDKENYKISGIIELMLDDHSSMPIEYVKNGFFKTTGAFKNGTNFQILMHNDHPAFVYTFGTDLTNEYYPIFPYNNTVSAALPNSSTQIALPDENNFIRLTGEPGKDYLCIILSKTPININSEMNKLMHFSNSLIDNIQNQFHSYLDNSAVSFSCQGNKIQFDATATTQNAVMVIVEIDHIL